jgi:ribonuclease E
VQVPVDVGTFLLNEKRIDIARIEARHRVNLLIIPNRHLETPQHEIIRLRHDQLNLEGTTLASYEMAIKPAEEEAATGAGETRAPRAEAAVKGITPDQPAPTGAPKEAEPAAPAPGFFSRIMSWLTGGDKKEAVVEETPKKSERPGRRERGERGEGGERGDRSDRGGRGRREGREGRDRNERGDRGERKERAERTEGGKEPREGRQNRNERGDRPERGERKERAERTEGSKEQRDGRQNRQKPVATETEAPAIMGAVPSEGNAPAETNGEGGRRRGRRGGRNRGERQLEEVSAAVAAVSTPVTEATEQTSAPAETLVQMEAPVVAEVQAPAIEPHGAVLPAPSFVEPASEPVIAAAPVVVAEPVVASGPVAIIEAAPETVPAPANIPAAIAAPAEPIDISAELQKVGLQLIETSGAVPVPVVQTSAQPLGRKPKPAPVINSEPLQMVETQHRD